MRGGWQALQVVLDSLLRDLGVLKPEGSTDCGEGSRHASLALLQRATIIAQLERKGQRDQAEQDEADGGGGRELDHLRGGLGWPPH